MTYLLMRDSGAKTDKQTDYGVWKHMYRRTCRWTRKQENKQTKKICARMPVYHVLFRSKFSIVSGHVIKCLVIEFCWAGRENIRLSVTKQGPRYAPTT